MLSLLFEIKIKSYLWMAYEITFYTGIVIKTPNISWVNLRVPKVMTILGL